MAKSQLPNPMMPSLQPAKSAPVSDSLQDQTTEQPVTNGNGTGHGKQTAVSATELWWRTFTLSSREAAAGSPMGYAACGEEDPGSGLELLVSQKRRRDDPS